MLRLYPRAFQRRFARAMEQTFVDLYQAKAEAGEPVMGLLARVGVDTIGGIAAETARAWVGRAANTPLLAATLAVLCAAPLLAMNHVVALRIDPLFSLLRPGPHTSTQEVVVLVAVLLLLPVGAALASLPARRPNKRSPALLLNVVLALALLAAFVTIAAGLGADFYRCDVLGIPNCD